MRNRPATTSLGHSGSSLVDDSVSVPGRPGTGVTGPRLVRHAGLETTKDPKTALHAVKASTMIPQANVAIVTGTPALAYSQ
jgi:hypothetical protein